MYARWITRMLLIALLAAVSGCRHVGPVTGLPTSYNLPPANRIMEPGPGVGGPGPGVMMPPFGPAAPDAQPQQAAQIMFGRPEGMLVYWDVSSVGGYDSEPLVCPGRQNFQQGGIYGLKLTNIEGHEGVELYPTIEIGPTTPRTAAYLSHNAIPIQFTPEDFDQVLAGNYVTKVIYLPDPEFQELAIAVDTLVSTRLDPGVDPIVEADRRGAILAIIRMGNIDKRMPVDENGLGGDAVPAHYQAAAAAAAAGHPLPGTPLPYTGGGSVPNYVSGVTAPYYGMPISGTPIGLPGPPHVPLGAPAGLQEHTMRNHTHMHMPGPTRDLQFHVQHAPGYAYPAPADRVIVREQTFMPFNVNRQPPGDMVHGYPLGGRHGHAHGHGHPHGCGCQQCQATGDAAGAAADNGNGNGNGS